MNNIQNIVVVGLGNISHRHRSNLKSLAPSSFITAVSASGKKPCGQVLDADAVLSDINDLNIGDVDFAIIASPAPFHKKHADYFLKNNIPVLIEKPITTSVDEAHDLLQLARENDVPVAIGYCLRYLPAIQMMKQLISSNFLGEIYNAFINVGQYLPDWRPNKDFRGSVSAKKELGGGVLFELSHEIDYASFLFGSMSFEFGALRHTNELDLEVEEIADIILRTNTGALCSIHLDFLQKKPQRNCSIVGEKGRLDYDLLKNTIYFHGANGSDQIFDGEDWDKNNMYLDMIKSFMNSIKEKDTNFESIEQSIVTLKLINDIQVSSGRSRVK